LLCYVSFEKLELGNERNTKKKNSIFGIDTQLQIYFCQQHNGWKTDNADSSHDIASMIKKEISLFSGGESRCFCICTQIAYTFLLTIPLF